MLFVCQTTNQTIRLQKNDILKLLIEGIEFGYFLLIAVQRLCMVSCDYYATNLAKGNRTLGKSVGFSE